MSPPLKRTAHIVLVEDNPADVLLVRIALKERGIKSELTCFEDGQKALKSLSQKRQKEPDLILLDLNLCGIEGIDVLRKIRSTPGLSEVPVIILSSSDSPTDMHLTQLLGAVRYIRKPTMLDDFLQEVGSGVEEVLLEVDPIVWTKNRQSLDGAAG